MSDRDAVLFANEAFYLAIANRDMTAMTQIWAEDPVACLHPGWAALVGRADVLDSWERILSHDAAPKIACREPCVLLHGETAVVVCYEEVDRELLVATNIFRREARHWRMVHHQAGPTAAQLSPEEEPPAGGARPN
jgi:ketosteroid isomerase-like protein